MTDDTSQLVGQQQVTDYHGEHPPLDDQTKALIRQESGNNKADKIVRLLEQIVVSLEEQNHLLQVLVRGKDAAQGS
jgi:hypothetical protein